MTNGQFTAFIMQKGEEFFRPMPWRLDTRPYCVLVSEVMLQQTQVARVVPKFEQFMARFADMYALAAAARREVVTAWQGLGYNRRAMYLHDAARVIVKQGGVLPNRIDQLQQLPGIGPNTAGAIVAYAFNQPSLFIETNIRTVYIHHFFAGHAVVSDAAIKQKLAQTLDYRHPRQFYWALMDYGASLKADGIKTNQRARHYRKQSPLAGSVRQVRGQIVSLLATQEPLAETEVHQRLAADQRFDAALASLKKDGLVTERAGRLMLGQ